MIKQKMAFIDLTNFKDWPTGGMLEYELSILRKLVKEYDIELWGVSIDGRQPEQVEIDGKYYKVNVYANVRTTKKVIPNFWKGFNIFFNKEFKKQNYDIVYGHSGSCMYGAIKALKHQNVVFAYHQHGLSYLTNKSLMSKTQKPFYYMSQINSDVVFLVTDNQSANDYFKKMSKKCNGKFIGIGSPINLNKFDFDKVNERIENGKDKKILNAIYVGRLSPEKNVVDMVYALKEYINLTKNNNIQLKLVGDGPDRKRVEDAISKNGLQNNIELCGSVSHEEVYKHLLNSDVFLISSNGEGVSISVLEAFASGLPVVCYDVPGLGKQNINGVTGVIAKEKTPMAFACGIIEAEKQKYNMSKNCILESKKYSDEEIATKIKKYINEALIMKGKNNE